MELGYISALSRSQRQLHRYSCCKNKSVTSILTHLVFLLMHMLFDTQDGFNKQLDVETVWYITLSMFWVCLPYSLLCIFIRHTQNLIWLCFFPQEMEHARWLYPVSHTSFSLCQFYCCEQNRSTYNGHATKCKIILKHFLLLSHFHETWYELHP